MRRKSRAKNMIIKFSDLLAKGGRNKEIKLSFEFQPVKFEGEEIESNEKQRVVEVRRERPSWFKSKLDD